MTSIVMVPAATQLASARLAMGILLLAAVAALVMPANASAQVVAVSAETDAALELYRLRLLLTGRRVARFPVTAIDQRLEGTAVVDLRVGMDGTLSASRVVQSSGHPVLDQSALDMLARAVPVTEIPSALANKAFIVMVAVAFVLPE